MSEAVYHKVQLGRESSVGTGVAATTVFPVDAGFLGFELDRAIESPDEDYGGSSREQPGRTSNGVRFASASLPVTLSFENCMHLFEMHCGAESPVGGGAPYSYTYTPDETSYTLKGYTVEYGDVASTQDEWEAVGVHATSLELGFDALTSPGNSMWKATANLVAFNRTAAAMTGSLSAPAALETIEGHLTTLSLGTTGTAFASLTAQTATLKSFSMTSEISLIPRVYGGTTDVPTAWGYSAKAEVPFEMMVKIDATRKTNFLDVLDVAGQITTEQRFRIANDGVSHNGISIDFRGKFNAVDLGDHEGERLYAVTGSMVYDATLGGRYQVILTNAVAAIP